MLIDEQSLVLFQGDSITDAGRNRQQSDSLGAGYAFMAASWIGAQHPELDIRFLNRGISGNRAADRKAWREDLDPRIRRGSPACS